MKLLFCAIFLAATWAFPAQAQTGKNARSYQSCAALADQRGFSSSMKGGSGRRQFIIDCRKGLQR